MRVKHDPETDMLVATWDKEPIMKWVVPGTSSTADDDEDATRPSRKVWEGAVTSTGVPVEVTEVKQNDERWFAMWSLASKKRVHMLQVKGFDPEHWEGAKDLIVDFAKRFCAGEVDKQKMEALKAD